MQRANLIRPIGDCDAEVLRNAFWGTSLDLAIGCPGNGGLDPPQTGWRSGIRQQPTRMRNARGGTD